MLSRIIAAVIVIAAFAVLTITTYPHPAASHPVPTRADDDAWIPCARAVKAGYYTPALFSQCIDDYHDSMTDHG